MGSDVESACSSIGSACSASGDVGGALFVSIGYMWKRLGFDVFAGATGDGGSRSFASRASGDESLSMGRLGGLVAIRLRGSVDVGPLRATLAAGPGLAYRMLTGTDDFTSTAALARSMFPSLTS